jgi:NitT/TauT family transport system substrate-binding protein
MVAQADGFYAAEGLDVAIIEGHGSDSTVQSVANGDSDFGYVDPIEILRGRAAGIETTAVSTLFQSNGVGILSLQADPVAKIADLHGRGIGVSHGSAGASVLRSALAANQVADATVISMDAADLVPALTDRRVAAIVASRDFEAVQLERLGQSVVDLPFADVGLPLAGLSIVTRPALIQEDPGFVARFVRATLQGWNAARSRPDVAGRLVVGEFLSGYEDEVTRQLRADLPLLCGPDNALIGDPSDTTWTTTQRLATALGLVAAATAPEGGYTREFLPADAPPCPS